MGELKELTLKVDVDTYKALQNYLHNELKITKPEMEEMIAKTIERIIIEKIMNDDEFLSKHVDKVIKESISRLGSTRSWVLEERIDSAVEKAVGEKIMQKVREQLKGITI